MKVNLTPAFIASAQCPPGRDRIIYWDEQLERFGFQVTTKGARSYVVQYFLHGSSSRMAINAVLTLTQARREARRLLGLVAVGRDPLEERRAARKVRENALRAVAETYFSTGMRGLRTAGARRAVFERTIFPRLGNRPIKDIRRAEVVRLLDEIERDRGPCAADETLKAIGSLFSWYSVRDDTFKSPLVRGMRRTSTKDRARQRVLSDQELRRVWEAADKAGAFGRMIQLLLLTGGRRNEVRCMRWSEIEGTDWTIPAARYKTKLDHLIPLSGAAQRVLAGIPRIAGGDFVFSSDGRRAIGGAGRRKADFDRLCGVANWTLHDLRRTARSLMSRAGVPADHAERALGHALPGIRGTYDRHSFYPEKQRAFEALASLIERIVNPQDNVVPMKSA
jgi:integrase